MTTKTSSNPWTMDVRVRERNLKAGSLTEKDLEKHLSALPDLEGQYDSFSTPQPALEQPRVVAAPVSALDDDSDDDLGDEADDDDDDTDDSTDDVGGGADEGGGAGNADEGGAGEVDGGGGDAGGGGDGDGDVPTEGGGEA